MFFRLTGVTEYSFWKTDISTIQAFAPDQMRSVVFVFRKNKNALTDGDFVLLKIHLFFFHEIFLYEKI